MLVFPDHGLAERTECHFNHLYGKYMVKHCQSWLAFANKVRYCGLKCLSELVLVTRCDLANRWAIALFSQEEREVSVAVEADIAGLAPATFDVSSGWRSSDFVRHRYGPLVIGDGRPTAHIFAPSDSTDWDQAIFIRGYRVKKRLRRWPKVIEAAAGPSSLADGGNSDDDTGVTRALCDTPGRDSSPVGSNRGSAELESFGIGTQTLICLGLYPRNLRRNCCHRPR